jgi:cytochrome P450
MAEQSPQADVLIPPQPRLGAFGEPMVLRLRRGYRSFLELLTPFSLQVPAGSETVLGKTLLLLNEPAAVRRVLVEETAAFPKPALIALLLTPLIGQGLFSANGREWQRQRRLFDEAFRTLPLEAWLPAMQAALEQLFVTLDQQADGRSVDLQEVMTLFSADVVVRATLSHPLARDDGQAIFQSFTHYQSRSALAMALRFLRLPRALVAASLLGSAAPIRQWVGRQVQARLAAARPPQDLLQALIRQGGFSPVELVDQLCVLLVAGHETTASALSMACYLLSRDPAAQDRLRQEAGAVFAESGGIGCGPRELLNLPYATAVFCETLRLYPPLPFLLREAGESTEIAGQRCPLRSLVTISPWVIHRHHRYWQQPSAFNPDRFLPGGDGASAGDHYLPFGLGPRRCPGAAVAQQEGVLALSRLVLRYELLPDSAHQPELLGKLTLRSRNGVRVRLRAMDGS